MSPAERNGTAPVNEDLVPPYEAPAQANETLPQPDNAPAPVNGDTLPAYSAPARANGHPAPPNTAPPNTPLAPVNGDPAPANGHPAPPDNTPAPANSDPARANGNPRPANRHPAPPDNTPARADDAPPPHHDTPAPPTSDPTPVHDDLVLVSLDAAGREVRRRCADVLYGAGDPALAEELLARYPGCLLVSVRDGSGRCVTLSRTGRRICAAPVTGEREHAQLAAALHRWLVGLSARPAPAAGPQGAGRPRG